MASKPTQSTLASTSGTPRIRSIWSGSGHAEGSTVSQPKPRACASRSALRSPTITTAAPSRNADVAAASPTGPAPAMSTVDPGAHPRSDAAVIPGGEDVGEHGQIQDLLQRLVTVRETQRGQVRIGHHHVLGLTTRPTTHVNLTVGPTLTLGVDVEADPGVALVAVAAPSTGDVERHSGSSLVDLSAGGPLRRQGRS